MRKTIAFGAAALSLAGLAAAAAPAGADSTLVTFAVAGGGLSMSIPSNGTVNLTSGGPLALGAPSVTGALNSTTVTDNRGSLLANWKVQVSSTDFVASTPANGTIANDNAGMYIDVANVAAIGSTLGMLTGGMVATSVATAATPASLAGAATTLVAGTTAVTGSITYTPTIKVTIPADTVADTYSGTVTQTAS